MLPSETISLSLALVVGLLPVLIWSRRSGRRRP